MDLRNHADYKLIMCDLDGTLVGRTHLTNPADVQALRRAMDAGMQISICTGRSWRESRALIAAMGLDITGVFSNGAELNCISTGESLHRSAIDDQTLTDLLEVLEALRLNSILLLHQSNPDDPLYAVSDLPALHPATRDWFARNGVAHLIRPGIDSAIRGKCLRVGIVLETHAALELRQHLEQNFSHRLNFHLLGALHFQAAILEIFGHGVDKWSGILQLCDAIGVSPDQVVTIGDDVNDIPMLKQAKLSYAMGNAPDHVRAAAKRITLTHGENGVAAAIDELLRAG